MAYTVAQTYTFDEFQHGTTTLRFVISNDYNALYNEEADIDTDIFMLDSISEDLNLEQGSYAVDEIQFAVDAAACLNEADDRALAFALGCTDVTKNRFCALFINPTFTAGVVDIETKKFVGKMVTKVGAEDVGWAQEDQYSTDTLPLRNWKFSALSFDISVLELIAMDMFYDGYFAAGNATETPDIAAIPEATFNALFEHKPFYSTGSFLPPDFIGIGVPQQTTYVSNLGNLKHIIQTYLDKAAIIMEHILTGSYSGPPIFEIELLGSSLGIGGIPVKYDFEHSPPDNSHAHIITETDARTDDIIQLALSDDDYTAVYIHRGMVLPTVRVTADGDETSSEKPYSFRGCENIVDLIFKIAAAFGCYPIFKFESATHITIQITPKQGIVSDDVTYVKDATKATLDMSSNFSEKNEKIYVGRSSDFALDGYDIFDYDVKPGESSGFVGTPNLSKRLEFDNNSRTKVRTEERTLLTTSTTIQEVAIDSKRLWYVPQNTILKFLTGPWAGTYQQLDFLGAGYLFSKELLHTAIYARITLTTAEQTDDFLSTETHAWRPISLIVIDIGGSQTAFSTLVGFVNHSFARDGVYYETERSMTVPSWSGFSHSSDGSSPSWKNIKNGSKIQQVERRLTLNESTNEWSTVETTETYIVVSVKTKLTDPEIDLKLHKVSRFAYATYTGETEGIAESHTHNMVTFPSTDTDTTPQVKSYICGEDITQYYAVTVQADETIIHSRSIASHYRKIVGIALESKATDEVCLVQIGGRCVITTASFTVGQPVYVRSGTWNITQNVLTSPSSTENLFFRIGKADSPTSFVFEIEQYKFNNTDIA